VVTLAKLIVEPHASIEFAVLVAIHIQDFAKYMVEIVNTWGMVGKQVLAIGNVFDYGYCW
jgi:hypothetical protein